MRRLACAASLLALTCGGAAYGQAPAQPPAPATGIDPTLAPNLTAIDELERARAAQLVEQAVPLLIASRFDQARPLLLAARTIYDRAYSPAEGLQRPLFMDQSALRNAALALPPSQAAEAELLIRYWLTLEYEYREDQEGIAFGAIGDEDNIVALALVLRRIGKAEAARRHIAALAAASPDLRANTLSELEHQVELLADAGQGAEAEALARFGMATITGPAGHEDHSYNNLLTRLAGLLKTRGATTELADLATTRRSDATVTALSDANRAVDAAIARHLEEGQRDEALALLARTTGGTAGRLDLKGARELLRIIDAEAQLSSRQQVETLSFVLPVFERHAREAEFEYSRLLTSLAGAHAELNRFEDAERFARRALALSEQKWGADTNGAIDDTVTLANILTKLARPAEAEVLLQRAVTLVERTRSPKDSDTFAIPIALTEVLLAQDRLDDADLVSEGILGKTRKIVRPGADGSVEWPDGLPEAVGGSPEALVALVLLEINRAKVLSRLERHDEAEAVLRSASARLPAVRPVRPSEIADVDHYGGFRFEIADLLAGAMEAQGRLKEAEAVRRERVARASLSLWESLGTGLGTNLSLQGRSGEADAVFAEIGRDLAKRYGQDSEPSATLARAYALHLLRSRRPGPALAQAEAALAAWRELQSRISPSAGELAYLERVRQQRAAGWLYARTAAAAQPGQVSDPLFHALQRSEFTAAGAALARRAARDSAAAVGAGALVDAWQAAQGELAALDRRVAELAMNGPESDTERVRLLGTREPLERRLAAAERALAERHPRFFDLISAQPLPLRDFQGPPGLLRADEALVILAPGSEDLPEGYRNGLVVVVTRETAALAEIKLEAPDLEDAVYLLHQQLAEAGTGRTAAAGKEPPPILFSRDNAHALYQALFGDARIAALLNGKERWTLAPQGSLISLPYAALVTEKPPGGAAGDGDPAQLRATRWLGIQRTLAVVPSIPSIAIQRRGAPRPSSGERTPFFGLGDPAFRGLADPPLPPPSATERAPRVTRAPDATRNYFRRGAADPEALATLDRLTGTAGEIRTLAALLQAPPAAVLLQLDATEAEIRRRNAAGDLRRAQVVAFATHGLVAGELGRTVAEPALALTPPQVPQAGLLRPENDGLLTASEAATLDLSAQWLILSACNTAAGGSANAESLSGLARAFFYAGARSILASHFPVFDAAAPFLTGEAVRLAQAEGMDRPAAMRQAMKLLIGNESNDAAGFSFAHPKAWAAFAVIDAD